MDLTLNKRLSLSSRAGKGKGSKSILTVYFQLKIPAWDKNDKIEKKKTKKKKKKDKQQWFSE